MISADAISRTDNDAGSVSSENKKRSKLGYHRTAVACSHCRRRKIRCVPSSDSPEAKCQNCARLKKDCHFHPVDQQDVASKKARSGSKADVALTDVTAMQISPSSESSIDIPLSRVESTRGIPDASMIWEPTSFISRPVTQYNSNQQVWPPQTSSNTRSPYIRHNSLPGPNSGQYYVPANPTPTMPYSQRQSIPINTASFAPESRTVHNDTLLEGTQYYGRRPSFGLFASNTTLQENLPNQYIPSFSGLERRSAMPVKYSSHEGQVSPQFQSDIGQYALLQFAAQNTQEPSYSQNAQEAYAGHQGGVLPGEDERRYVKYPS